MTTISSDSSLGLVRKALLDDSAVQALVGNRVSGGWSEDPDVGTIPRPSVAVVLGGGAFGGYEGVVRVMPVEVWTLSDVSSGESRAVYDACFAALQAAGLGGVDHRGLMAQVSGPRDGWWAAGRCWFTTGIWRLSAVRDTT